jgi:glycosyltransferase involved in cell wall biosynthesis
MTAIRSEMVDGNTMVSLSPASGSRAATPPLVSVLVPAKDEAENLPLFMQQAAAAFAGQKPEYEVVVIDDGSVDGTWETLQELAGRYPFLHAVKHRAGRGIAESLRTGYLNSRGSVLVFYPADLQYKPEDIPRLVQPIVDGSSDIVTGY